MDDKCLFEYSVVRFVPKVDREEFLNIGLVMMCKRYKWLQGKIEINENRIKAFDPRVNLELLKNQASMFVRKDLPKEDLPVEEKYRWMTAVKSAVFQTSPSHPGIINKKVCNLSNEKVISFLEEEFERLFSQLVTC